MTGDGAALVDARELEVLRGRTRVLNRLSLRLDCGDSLCVLGANGAGKSTLLRVLCGLLAPTAGSVRWLGGQLPTGVARVRLIGVALQNERPASLVVRELVTLGLGSNRAPNAAERELVDGSLRDFELERYAERSCLELSGGEWQRTRLARACVADPALLVLDEPTNHLDEGARTRLLGQIRARTERGRATLVATHDRAFAAHFVRVIGLDRADLGLEVSA